MRSFSQLLFLLALLSSCTDTGPYKLATSSKSASYLEVGQELAYLFETEPGVKLQVMSNEDMGSDLNVRLLGEQEVDFALAQGDTKMETPDLASAGLSDYHVKTVIPLYPEILFIIYPDTIKASTLNELVKGRKVGMGPKQGGTASFMKRLFGHYGIADDEYEAVYTSYSENVVSEQIQVSCALTGYNNTRIQEMLTRKGLAIFSLGDANLANKGSSVDGFCLIHGPARPFIIPKFTYTTKPKEPILTMAVDATLLAHSTVDKYVVYNLAEAIFENKQYLSSRNTLLTGITESFDHSNLNYPLHEGARMYLERDKPAFVERHGKLLGSILLALVTGIPMVYRWNQQRKKDSIDRFYKKLLKLEDRISAARELEALEACETEMKQIRDDAYTALISEKLDANPAFRIFTDLLREVRDQLEIKRGSFSNNQ